MVIRREEFGKLKSVTAEDDERLIKEGISESNKEYHAEHKEEIKEYMDQYKKEHEEELKEYWKRYNKEHREEKEEYNGKYNKEHKEEISEYNRNYNLENKEGSDEQHKEWRRKNPEKVLRMNKKRDAKRRSLGYEEILPIQWGCVQHHVDNIRVIPIPAAVHRQLSGHSQEKHRELVDEWMREIRPDLWLIVHTEEAFKDVFREMIERNSWEVSLK